MTLKEQYRAICNEYARQTGKIIGYEPQFFLRDRMAVNTCLFGDNYFLNMDQMQQIVDHMDKWLRHYGTIEKVGERVVEQIENFMKDSDLGNSAEEKFYKLDVLADIGLFIEQLKK